MKRMIIIVLGFVSFMIDAMGQNVEWAIYDCPDAEGFHSGLATFQDETTGKWGAINTSGEIAISPQYDEKLDFTGGCSIVKLGDVYGIMGANMQMILEPKYKNITRDLRNSNYFEVQNQNGKCGLFYNYQLIIPCLYSSVSIKKFPFASLYIEGGQSKTINLLTGRLYNFGNKQSGTDYYYVVTGDGTKEYYREGNYEEPLSDIELKTHPSGTILYEDDNGWGIKKNDKTILEPIYSCYPQMWLGDFVCLSKKDNNNNDWSYIFDYRGKEIIKYKEGENMSYSPIVNGFIEITKKNNDDRNYGLMDAKGKILLQPIYGYVVHLKENWFEILGEDRESVVYNALTNRKYNGSIMNVNKNDLIYILYEGGKYGYLNTKTGNFTGFIYTSCEEFVEGIGHAYSFGGDDVLLNEDLRTIMNSNNSEIHIQGNCGEGVVKVCKFSPNIYGYIYNPLGHGNYVYNNANAQKIRCKYMFDRGLGLFNKQKYVKAKDLFYQVMVLEPNNYEAIENYAACLNNMGYYDEAIQAHRMALDVNPNYELAAQNLEISLNNKNRPVQTTNSGTFWDALATFGKLAGQLGQTFSSMKGFDTSQTYFDSEGGYSSSEADANEDPATNGMSREAKANHYTQKYYSLESKVKNIYNSITSHRSTTNGKKRGVNTKTSVTDRSGDSDKKMMARYQTQMRQCRKMANYYGGHVAKSEYEDAKSSTLYL